jgi:hypothetical protein
MAENQARENSKEDEQKKQGKKPKRIIILVLMLLLLAALFVMQCELKNYKEAALRKQAVADSLATLAQETDRARLDSLARLGQLSAEDSAKLVQAKLDSARRTDSLRAADSLASAKNTNKGKSTAAKQPSSAVEQSSSAALPPEPPKKTDSIPPEASIVPPAGRYYAPIPLKVKCDEIHCATFLSIGDTLHSQPASEVVTYNKTGDVFFRAQDSAANFSPWQSAHYDMASDNVCGKNAYPVPVGSRTVCVDAYEYPNASDAEPKDMVSHEQAERICEQSGKRLCSIVEWQSACRGKDGLRYSYGSSYNQTKCNTNTNSSKRSGRKEQCRSWYGMYDMNGNMWEWTATPSKGHENYYLVAGGSWDSNNASSCLENKYSFYPQNQYHFVGFRCCKDAQ